MDNISLLLGNGCSLLATLSNVFASTRKTARGVLLVQSVGQAFYFACALFLKAPSGAVQNAVSIVRNFVAMGKKKSSKWVEWALIAAAVVLGVGRAIGEAMAVMMVSGNVANMPGLFESVRFLTTAVSSGMGYADGLYREALFSIALVLFLFIMLINATLNFFLKGEKK